jgi:hypothetical protein
MIQAHGGPTKALRAYRALKKAADRMGANNFAKLSARDQQRVAKHGFSRARIAWPTEAHGDVVAAMDDMLNGRIDHEGAMSLLLRSDVFRERFADAKEWK